MKLPPFSLASLAAFSLLACSREDVADSATAYQSAPFQLAIGEATLELSGIGPSAYLEGPDGSVRSIRLSLLSKDQKRTEDFTSAHVGDALTILSGDFEIGSGKLYSAVSSSITFDGLDGRLPKHVEERIRQASGEELEVWPFQGTVVSGDTIDEMVDEIFRADETIQAEQATGADR